MTRKVFLVTVTLLLALGVRTWVSHAAVAPPERLALKGFPTQIGAWTMTQQQELSDPVSGVLKADDYLLRTYRRADRQEVDLFVAYYRSQKAGESMHSPRNCLPGWGWQIVQTDYIALEEGNVPHPTLINRYLIEKDQNRALVLYWYQANGRIIANEYWGKIYLVVDALRTGRRDGSIVRLVVPIAKGSDGDVELSAALRLAREAAPLLTPYLPN